MKKILAFIALCAGAVFAFLKLRSRPVTVKPGKIDAPLPQDDSGTLSREELAALIAEVRGRK